MIARRRESGVADVTCEESGIHGETVDDTDTPATDDGYFYLVTVENRIGEEGTKGSDSDGNRRANVAACP